MKKEKNSEYVRPVVSVFCLRSSELVCASVNERYKIEGVVSGDNLFA